MGARLPALAGVVGAAVAAIVFALPADARFPVMAGAAALVFGLYAMRVRGSLRGMHSALRSLRERERAQDNVLTDIVSTLKDQDRIADGNSARLEQVQGVIQELHNAQRQRAATDSEVTGEIIDRLVGMNDRLVGVQKSASAAATQAELRKLHERSLAAANRTYQQMESLLGLHALFRVRAPLPPSRGWAASPDLLLYLITHVVAHRPRLIVELGGGLSTVWLSYAVESLGHGGRIISLDHDPQYASTTRSLLAAHGLGNIAEVREAPLTAVSLDGEVWSWYSPASLEDIADCDLLIVDGPPGETRERARYPALPLFMGRMAKHATVVLDDCVRQDEKDVVAKWQEQYPEWQVEIISHEKGTAVLTR